MIVPTLLLISRMSVAEDIPLKNWAAPAWWSLPRAHGVTTLTDTNPLPFIAITPCRVADTRGNGFTGAYGPLTPGSSRREPEPSRKYYSLPAAALDRTSSTSRLGEA